MKQTALLIIDMQRAFDLEGWGERNNPQAEEEALQVLSYFRQEQLPVIHIQHLSEDPHSRFHRSQGQDFKEGFAPLGQEIVFQKRTNSAFIGTDLEKHLHSSGIQKLVIVGLTLPHCVSTTTRMAANLGFEVSLLADATASFALPDQSGQVIHPKQIHEINLISLDHEFAQVLNSKEWLANTNKIKE